MASTASPMQGASSGSASVPPRDPAAAPADDEEFSIRDLSDAFGATPRALRFYEAQGLLFPQRDGQRRIYSARDRARLQLILRGKKFGFSLAEIRELLDLYDLGDEQTTQLERTLEIAEGKLHELEARKIELIETIAELRGQMTLVRDMLTKRRAASDDADGEH